MNCILTASLILLPTVRMVGFILRAVIAASISASTSLGLVISQQVIYNIGFFGLLYSAYTLVLDRYNPLKLIPSRMPRCSNLLSVGTS